MDPDSLEMLDPDPDSMNPGSTALNELLKICVHCFVQLQYTVPDKFLESPVLALDKAVGALALHGLGLLALGVQDAELELGPHLALVTRHCPARPSINQSVFKWRTSFNCNFLIFL
jgi:hypothetical protein